MTYAYDITEWPSFLPQIMPHCPDVIDAVAINAVRNACIEFLEESHWLQVSLPALTGAAGIASYPVVAPEEDVELVRLQAAYYDNMPLTPKSEEELRRMYPTFDFRKITGNPRWYMRDPDDSGSILLVPCPQITETAALAVVAVLRPTRAAAGVDSTVYEKWLEEISAGAIARLMYTPNESYSNARMAGKWEAQFRGGIGKAKIDRNRSLERAALRMRPPRFTA